MTLEVDVFRIVCYKDVNEKDFSPGKPHLNGSKSFNLVNLMFTAWCSENGVGLTALNELCTLLGRQKLFSYNKYRRCLDVLSKIRCKLAEECMEESISDLKDFIKKSEGKITLQFKIDGAWANYARLNATTAYSYLVFDGQVLGYSLVYF